MRVADFGKWPDPVCCARCFPLLLVLPVISRPPSSHDTRAPIAFIDLKAQRRRLGSAVDAAMMRVLDHGAFVLGPEVAMLEARLAERAGVRHAISCASGMDALVMLLMAHDIGPGDAVLCPSFTFAATAEAIALRGATPVFVDVRPDDFNMDPESAASAIAALPAHLTLRGIIAVDLFGQPADYPALSALAARHGVWLLADAAQSFGARLGNHAVGSLGDFAITSFFPAKPLGAYGDGGAIFTEDARLRDILLSIRVHGQGLDKYENVRLGLTARLDTVQAAVLLEKLEIFDEEIVARNRVAARYAAGLAGMVQTPQLAPDRSSVWAQYTVRSDHRDALVAALKADGVPTAIYYPRPLHRQAPYAAALVAPGGLPVTEQLAASVFSLPMHPYLEAEVQDYIIERVCAHCEHR